MTELRVPGKFWAAMHCRLRSKPGPKTELSSVLQDASSVFTWNLLLTLRATSRARATWEGREGLVPPRDQDDGLKPDA